MDKDNPAFTGFFNNGHKRIDLVLVIESQTILYYGVKSETIEDRIINYLTRIIKFGLELELEEGRMIEHKNLIFIKVHAPDWIIEEYGNYFNLRKFFKDSHVDRIGQFFYPLGMKHPESIKFIREQYPGPDGYSTLERSRIVYNIIHRLPFRFGHEELSGIYQLLKHDIIVDVYALHDGPYFLTPGQKTCFNARQSLFYNWVGIRNIWRPQPLHMIQEYLGDRVAMYLAYYEYFIFMLLFPAILGLVVNVVYYYGKPPDKDILAQHACSPKLNGSYICPQCRYFDLCPFRNVASYCKELEFISMNDKYMRYFAIFVSIWAIVFTLLWLRIQNYLTWMWEINDQFIENIAVTKYYSARTFYRSRLTGVTIAKLNLAATIKWSLLILLFAILFGVWLFGLFVISTQIWYVKYWLAKMFNVREQYEYELLFIGVGAGVYSILTTALKMIAKMLTYKLTARENNTTIGSYSRSLALKLYGFYFSGTFALLTLHLFVGNIFFTHLLDLKNWFTISGFKVMNNGLGSSLDDMYITLAVAVVIEQIIVRIPLYFMRKNSEYQCVLSKSAPSWEREYKLDTLRDEYFHNEYNDIAIQFAMATLFSLAFPLAPLLIIFINIWDIRHKARNILLGYRRPLLHNNTGPVIWHKIILFTSYLVPIFHIFIIALQSRSFLVEEAFAESNRRILKTRNPRLSKTYYYFLGKTQFMSYKATQLEFRNMKIRVPGCIQPAFDYYWISRNFMLQTPEILAEYPKLHSIFFRYQYIIVYCIASVILNLLLCSIFPAQSSDIEDALKVEKRIKQKYSILKGYLLH